MESRPTLPLDSKAGKLSSDSSGKCSCNELLLEQIRRQLQ